MVNACSASMIFTKSSAILVRLIRSLIEKLFCDLISAWRLEGCDVCAVEKAASGPQHAPDGRRMDSIGTRDIRLRLAIGKPLERFLTLVGSQLRRTAKPDPTGLCTASALACTSTDQLALELGQATEHRQHEAAMRGCRVRPCVLKRTEAGLRLGHRVPHIEQVPR